MRADVLEQIKICTRNSFLRYICLPKGAARQLLQVTPCIETVLEERIQALEFKLSGDETEWQTIKRCQDHSKPVG